MGAPKAIWPSFVIILLGIWLIFSPATFGFSSKPLIFSDWIVGALFILLGFLNRKETSYFFPWVIGFLGIWLQAAPLIFWAPEPVSYLTDTMIGVMAIALSLLIPKMPNERAEEPSIPPGWSYNPSSWAQRAPIALLAFLCWMFSRYLAAFELGYISTAWDPFFHQGTMDVLTSKVSNAFPLPDAGMGAFAYTLEFLSTCQGGKARWRTDPWLVLVFGLLVLPVGLTSICLVILQPLIVGAWCTLCLTTAVCMLIAIPFALDEVAAALQYLKHAKTSSFCKLLFQGGECPGAGKDTETPSLTAPLFTWMRASVRGISCPWNLAASALLGIGLMALPANGWLADIDPILGALTAVVSVLATSELARRLRFVNLFFSALLLIAIFVLFAELTSLQIVLHMIVAVLLALFSFRKGHFYEHTAWH